MAIVILEVTVPDDSVHLPPADIVTLAVRNPRMVRKLPHILGAYEAIRLRRICNILGLGTAIPAKDSDLAEVLFSVLGMIARKIEQMFSGELVDTLLYGLYRRRSVETYEGDSSSRESLLMVDYSEQALRDRWNAKQRDYCIQYGYGHRGYFKEIPPPFKGEGNRLHYTGSGGSTGGGYYSVDYDVSIRLLEQWDDKSE